MSKFITILIKYHITPPHTLFIAPQLYEDICPMCFLPDIFLKERKKKMHEKTCFKESLKWFYIKKYCVIFPYIKVGSDV